MINGPHQIYVERHGKLEETDVRFRDVEDLVRIIDRIVAPLGRRVDESSPMVDARLPDGSRVNVIIPPLSLVGPCLSIRKFRRSAMAMDDLVRLGALTKEMGEFLRACVLARMNIVISGGTSSGKTTLLNSLSAFIPGDERIITIEDAAELQLQQRHIIRLEARPANVEGRGHVSIRQLVTNALRMRPDRIVVGEVRGEEALDMLQAMNTGHDGSLTTIHANTPRDALGRLETMVAMANLGIPESATRRQIASALNVVVQVARMSDGTRKVTSVSELTGMEGDVVTMQEIFEFKRTGIGEKGEVLGEFVPTGIRPKFSERLLTAGVRLPMGMFDRPRGF
jgi:pilus assembly protein CpaF